LNKKCYCILILTFAFFLSDQSFSQFIANKGNPNPESYRNFAGRNYENYSTSFIKKKFFDNFGNFLIEGTTVYELSEVQSQRTDLDIRATGTSDILKSRYYSTYFNNLVIGNDSYGGFESRLMVGDAIRTKFTDLTFNKARFNGIRWDAGTAKYRGTVVASRISDPIRFRFDDVLRIAGVRRIRDWTQYLFGGHFETDIGDVLTVGATYVNQHQRRSSLDSKEASLEGVVTNAIPRVIFLRISDNSPNDNSGPIIFAPPTIIINGQPRQIENIHFRSPAGGSVNLNQPIKYWVLENPQSGEGFTINDRNFFAGADTTSYSRYQNYRARYSVPPPTYPYQIPSSDRRNLTYAFVIPEGTESVQFQMILANDFRVETAQDYINVGDNYGGAGFRSHNDSTALGAPTPFFIRATAKGNVRDGSNKQIVTVNYGLTSGMSVYGVNFDFKWKGFEIQGEFNESVEFLKYPLLSGNRFESKGRAWFLRGKKKLGRFTLGGERYLIGPDYTTWLNTYVLENSFYATPVENSITSIPLPIAPDFAGFDASTPIIGTILFPGGVFYPLVDDNDDNDRYEDGFWHYNVNPTDVNQRNRDVINPQGGDYFKLGYRQNINELRSVGDIIRTPDAGIFPGKDRDNDGIPDDDRNADGIPDFAQDFLTYYADPPTLDYGDDWNNNGVIDEQENDILPDYPYEPDIDGYHLFSNLELLDGLNLFVGKINEEAISRGGVNDVNYFKTEYFTSTPKFGAFRLFYVLKQVQDNIPNNGYQFRGVITAADPFPDFVIDPLNYRNSLVNSLYLGTRYTQIQNVNIENNLRIELNRQFSIGSRDLAFLPEARLLGDQVPGRIVLWGMVNKIDYTFSLLNGSLRLSPQLKVRTEKTTKFSEDRTGVPTVEISYNQQEIIPIFRVDYNLTQGTVLRFGVQGFTLFGLSDFFLYRIRNFKDNVDSQNRSTIAFSVSNTSQYAGYNIVIDFGFKNTSISFLRPEDQTKGSQESTLFFNVYAGF
jgi:hypothetical protein